MGDREIDKKLPRELLFDSGWLGNENMQKKKKTRRKNLRASRRKIIRKP